MFDGFFPQVKYVNWLCSFAYVAVKTKRWTSMLSLKVRTFKSSLKLETGTNSVKCLSKVL